MVCMYLKEQRVRSEIPAAVEQKNPTTDRCQGIHLQRIVKLWQLFEPVKRVAIYDYVTVTLKEPGLMILEVVSV